MATSVIDYIFRDLAISYLKRSELGQVKPEDLVATATTSDIESQEGKHRNPKPEKNPAFRSPVVPAIPAAPSSQASSVSAVGKQLKGQGGNSGLGNITKGNAPASPGIPHTVAAPLSSPQPQTQIAVIEESYPEESEVIKIVQARIKGYEGDPCTNCGSFTLVRNGTCMKCDTCGGTTGCS
jgi:ribonucleoside-diphosphate reductase alpha chain